jgi:hypothetical protein|tara:strand:- start:1924 stop:2331 length:408 start_codon:yes stop_codon:yes gene_type:complete
MIFKKNKDHLLHQVFKGLNTFVERTMFKQYENDTLKSLEYLATKTGELKLEYKELMACWKWYNIDRPKREAKNDLGHSMMYYEQDTKMLARAISLRKFSEKLFKGGDYEPRIGTFQATRKSITKGRNVGKGETTQ